ncbi:hypothetical protein KIPB_009025, partial [Kipferlia bialata]|eukprot:g9025.t1
MVFAPSPGVHDLLSHFEYDSALILAEELYAAHQTLPAAVGVGHVLFAMQRMHGVVMLLRPVISSALGETEREREGGREGGAYLDALSHGVYILARALDALGRDRE